MRIINNLFIFLILSITLSSCNVMNQSIKDLGNFSSKSHTERQIDKAPQPIAQTPVQPIPTPAPTIVKKKIKIAALFPLSGKNKELGQSLLNSALISLFENDKNNNLELVVFDVGEGPADAVNAIKEVVKNNIKIVLGPVFSTSLAVIEDTVRKNNITVLSFSNNMELTNKKGIFLMGFFPEQQVEKAVSYATAARLDSFSIIAPNNPYGLKISDIYKDVIKRKDGDFITSEFYLSNSKDIERLASRVVDSFTIPERLYENHSVKKKVKTTIAERDRVYSKVIFIPESGKILSKIVAAIKKHNVNEREFQIIGTNQWDNSATLDDANLVGSWFISADPQYYKDFEKKYYQMFGKFPIRIDSISYDAILAISDLANKTGKKDLKFEDFTKYDGPKNGFVGIDGLFRFLPNGITQRNLAVIRVGIGKFEVIDSPANIFLRY